MLTSNALGVLLGTLLLVFWIPDASSYSKYGRTCQDIRCRSDEHCELAEDPCTVSSDRCGRYPTCVRTQAGGASCSSIVCPENKYCKTESGIPRCVEKTASNVPTGRPGQRQRYTTARPRATPPTPPPRSSSYGRNSGYSGSRNTIGDNSIWNRLFGDQNRNRGSVEPTTSRPITNLGGKGYYDSHTSVDSHGNRVWTFSG